MAEERVWVPPRVPVDPGAGLPGCVAILSPRPLATLRELQPNPGWHAEKGVTSLEAKICVRLNA